MSDHTLQGQEDEFLRDMESDTMLKTRTCGALAKCEEAAAELIRGRDELRRLLSECDGKLGKTPCRDNRCLKFSELKAENERLRKDA